jgi:hypothetical protein
MGIIGGQEDLGRIKELLPVVATFEPAKPKDKPSFESRCDFAVVN